MRLALISGRTRREIAEDLGIGLSTLTPWLGQERDASEPVEAPIDVHAGGTRIEGYSEANPFHAFFDTGPWLGLRSRISRKAGPG